MDRNKILILLATILILFPAISHGQEKERSWTLNGFLEGMNNLWIPPGSSQWETMYSIKNRFDFRWYPAKFVSFHAGARTNMDFGKMIQDFYPYIVDFATLDEGYFDMTWLWAKDTSYYFYTNVDRLNMKLKAGSFEATVGRQRINWGINMVWTPNDIFNSYNYFDFDYVERPGCDAIRLVYYTGLTSSIEGAFKMDRQDRITSALMYRFNKWSYDFQFLAGVMNKDAVAGLGWSGQIEGAGFNGEVSYFRDLDRFSDTTGVMVGSIGANYTLKNGLYMHGSYLYNSAGTTGLAGWGTALTLFVDISAKNFTRARHSIFAELAYPVTPLVRVDLASIYNPNDRSGFVGPSVDISLTDNLSLFFISQLFWGVGGSEFGDYGSLYYLRLKWSF